MERGGGVCLSLTHTLICPHVHQSSPCLCAFLSVSGSGAKISSVTQLPLCPAKICFCLLADFSFVCFCDMTGKSWTRWELLWWRRGDWRRRKKEIPEGDTEAPPPPHFYFLRRVSFWRILGNEKCYKNNVDRDSVSVSRISIICSRNCICRWLDMQTEYSWASKICHRILPRPFKLP